RAHGTSPAVQRSSEKHAWAPTPQNPKKPHRALLLCQNRSGYLRLCDLLTRAFRTNQHRSRAEISKAWFQESGTEGLIALSGARFGDVGTALLAGNITSAGLLARGWAELFPQ